MIKVFVCSHMGWKTGKPRQKSPTPPPQLFSRTNWAAIYPVQRQVKNSTKMTTMERKVNGLIKRMHKEQQSNIWLFEQHSTIFSQKLTEIRINRTKQSVQPIIADTFHACTRITQFCFPLIYFLYLTHNSVVHLPDVSVWLYTIVLISK